MKSILRAGAAAALIALPLLAQAQGTKPEPAFTFTGNAGLFSDYRFRGYSQTGYKPAFQGGFDFAHKSGFYAGNWNSNVEQGLYNGASLEMDFYGGYKTSIGDFGLDVGYLYYFYPGTGAAGSTKIKNGEFYVGGSYGPVSAKVFYATTKFFSLGEGQAGIDTAGAIYLDLSGNFDLGGGFTLNAHYGLQQVPDGKKLFAAGLVGADKDSVGDYKLGVTYDLSGWALGAAIVGTTEKKFFTTARSGFTEGAGKTSLVVSVGKTF